MDWTALVPIKQGDTGKSRLGGLLDRVERNRLCARMAAHVLEVLENCAHVRETVILAPERQEGWLGGWAPDHGRGLNAELAIWRSGFGATPLLVIHADLPLLSLADLDVLLTRAKADGAAMATDRAGSGTNALALADGRPLDFCFGPGSRHLHESQGVTVLTSPGLAADLDTPDDLAFARRGGFAD